MAEELQVAEGAETEEGKAVDAQFAEADSKADPQEPLSVEDIAARGGWVPQDKFKGPAEKWKPADQFLLDGHEIKDRVSRDLKGLRDTVETIKQTNGAILAERLAEERGKLAAQYAAAVEKGDPDEAWRASSAIHALNGQAQALNGQPRATPAPETENWVQRNAKVQADPVVWRDALAICDAYARQYPNSSPNEQLAYTESHLKVRYPHLFDEKGPAQVHAPTSRSTAGAPRGKTAADLPKEARDVAKDMVERGLIKDEQAYADNYFEMLAKRGQKQ
jgi:hypothetical protein